MESPSDLVRLLSWNFNYFVLFSFVQCVAGLQRHAENCSDRGKNIASDIELRFERVASRHVLFDEASRVEK